MSADETDVTDLLKMLGRWPQNAKIACGKIARLQLQALFLTDDKRKLTGWFKGIKMNYK